MFASEGGKIDVVRHLTARQANVNAVTKVNV